MEILGAAFLIGSGMYLNSQDKTPKQITETFTKSKNVNTSDTTCNFISGANRCNSNLPINRCNSTLANDQANANKVFTLQFFKKKEITNPNFNEKLLWSDLDKNTMARIKSRVDITKKAVDQKINDVGFDSANLVGYDTYTTNEVLPSIDDSDRDIQMIHNNMVPFFGSTVKQNVNDTAFTQQVLENYTGNFRHTRRDNKSEVENLFDPTPNNQLPYGANSNMATNRDLSRLFPSNNGKKNNELPFEQIYVGPGIADGYTSRPSGGFHQDVRILPKVTEELYVNPKVSYEARINAGKNVTENGKLIGEQIIKAPKSIVYNWKGERNFTGMSSHRKNKQRPNVILKCTSKDKLHSEYSGIAAPTAKSQNTAESLRGKKRIAHKRNFLNDLYRNLVQASGKKMNDFSKSGIENKETERSMQSERNHYTNVTQVGGKRGQQYNFNDTGLRYTRKQELINNRPDGSSTGKAGPKLTTKGPVYDQNETTKVTIRQTTEDNNHVGFIGKHIIKGPTYNQDDTGKVTIRQTTEDNNHAGFVGKHVIKGPTYDQNETARNTIRQTTEDNNHVGFIGDKNHKGKVYNQGETTKVTIRQTTEDNNHVGFVGDVIHKGKVYDQNDTTKVTIRQTTEDNNHVGFIGDKNHKGKVYNQEETTKVTIRQTTEDNNHHGFVGKHVLKGKSYDQNETAKVTIRQTTEDSNFVPGVNSSTLQSGGGYQTTPMEAKNTQRGYLCDNEYVGGGEATTNKKPKSYYGNYQINTNKEQIAVGRAPNEVKNFIAAGKEAVNICVNKLELDRVTPQLLGKGSSIGNMYEPANICNLTLTSRKNVTPYQVDRLQIDTLDGVKNNPLMINQNIN